MRLVVLPVVIAAMLGGVAAAQTAAPEAPAGEAAQKPAEKLICRRETETGSHRTVKICRTQKQIDTAKEQADRFMRPGERVDMATPPAASGT
jgi:hypothetical protein